MKLRVRGKREDVSLDVIWNEKQTPLEGHRNMSPDDAWGSDFSCRLRQGRVRAVGKTCSMGYISYMSLSFPFHGSHPHLSPNSLSLSLQLLNSWSSGSLLIYPRKPHQISCPLMPWWSYHSCVPNPPEPCITCWSRVGSSFLAWRSMLWQSLL